MPKYTRRYRRRSSKSIRRSKKIPVILGICLIAALCIGLVILAATLVGLKLKSEAEKYEKPTEFEYIEPEIQIAKPSGDMRPVNAQTYRFSDSLGNLLSQDITDLSIMLRDAEGTLYYNSEIAQAVGWDSVYKSVDLSDEAQSIHKYGGYICGYMYVGSFADESNIAEVKREYEIRLIHEAAAAGVDEILLLGVDVTEENLREVLVFLSDIKSGVGSCRIGIELDYEDVVVSDPESYLPQIILQTCDFISLDASSVPCAENADELDVDADAAKKDFYTAIEEIYYYTSGMGIRLTFNNNERSMYKAVGECTYVNRQIHE